MIHAAAEMYAKEKDVSRVLYDGEMRKIVNRVFAGQKIDPDTSELSYVFMGAKALIKNRDFVSNIVSRWTHGKVSLESEDIKKSKEVFENTLKDFAEQ